MTLTQPLVLNITSLIKWHSKPNGIIRVHIELLRLLLDSKTIIAERGLYFVRYCSDLNSFVRCEAGILTAALKRFQISIKDNQVLRKNSSERPFGQPFVFIRNDHFLTMGFDWDDYPPVELLRIRGNDINVFAIIYDLIPIKYANHSVKAVVQSFPYFLNYVSWAATHVFTISTSTKNDLLDLLKKNNWRAPDVSVAYLGSTFSKLDNVQVKSFVKRYQIFYLSTLEPRKNHVILLSAYKNLLEAGFHPPTLYIIGNDGWGGVGELLQNELIANTVLAKYIKIICGPSDDDLQELMRESLFSVYPSYYEGWGLPVVEALSLGIPTICSNCSSLPEASQGLTSLLPPDDVTAWSNEIMRFATDKFLRDSMEEKISREFIKFDWPQFSIEIVQVMNAVH
jgi:glycosyltransferase involved in cell wall biosynthesis